MSAMLTKTLFPGVAVVTGAGGTGRFIQMWSNDDQYDLTNDFRAIQESVLLLRRLLHRQGASA
jgi:hypothetical protein